ncbi:methyltransferase domain-containing protein [Mycobacterium sp. TJFP1]
MLTSTAEALICQNTACLQAYPVVHGVPILIDERSSVFDISDYVESRDTYFPSQTRLRRLLGRLVPDIGKNLKAVTNYSTFAELVLHLDAKPRVLVLGGGELGQGLEELFRYAEIEVIESDVALGSRVAVIIDGHSIPFRGEMFDGVIAQAVLEHVIDPYKVVDEIHRVLKPSGIVYAETPFMQQVHGGRYDFMRFTHLGHRRLFRRFDEHSSGAVSGTGMALAWSYKYFLRSLTKSATLQKILTAFAALTSFFLKYVDHLIVDRPASLDAASGLYFMGRKSEGVLSDRDLIQQYRGSI